MVKRRTVFALALPFCLSTFAQTSPDSSFKLALPDHKGQLTWSGDGFKIVQSSAKPNGQEIGIRGQDGSGRLGFLGFLFVFPEQALTSRKCREGVLGPLFKSTPSLKMVGTSESSRSDDLTIAYADYEGKKPSGSPVYSARGFLATDDICGDLEFYSDKPIGVEDPELKKIFATYRLDPRYSPKFTDVFLYAQVLFKEQLYKAAGPMFEAALVKFSEDPATATQDGKRVLTDQAGMSYGMSGDIAKARAIFERAIKEDPDYPKYYYNLACADAEEKKISAAKRHLDEAFARKANVIRGEAMPDPTKDSSFLPYRNNKEFWKFLESLHASK